MKKGNSQTEKKENLSFGTIIRQLFPIIIGIAPAYFFAVQLMSIVHSLSHVASVYIKANLFDEAAEAVSSGGNIPKILWAILLVGLITAFTEIMNGVHNFFTMQHQKVINGKMMQRLHQKASRLNPIVYENSASLDDINKAEAGVENAGALSFVFSGLITFYLPYFVGMGFYLFTLKPILLLSLVLVFVPTFFSQIIRTNVFIRFEDQAAPVRRKMEYYEGCVAKREFFKETRLLGGFRFFHDLFLDAVSLFSRESWRAERKTSLWEAAMRLLTLAGYGGILFLLIDALLKGEISIGSFSAVFSSITMMFGIMEEIVCSHFGYLMKELGTVRNLLRFMDLPERNASGENPDISMGISLENVTFTYPGKDVPSLKNVSLQIYPKETLAVVGSNGAGKSTLVKLMTGLYLPTSGDVCMGKTNTRELGLNYSGISGVFQQYGQYKMTLAENISISAPEQADGDLDEAARKANVDVAMEAYPDGMNTVLSKEFDGVDISGGQWQRIAIARGLYRVHDVIVLDEPTSAIDPVEETRVYQQFADISKDVMAVIVTHRLGSARIADRIVVMNDGEIAEVGSHEELLKKNGKYREMWDAQAQYYVNVAEEAV